MVQKSIASQSSSFQGRAFELFDDPFVKEQFQRRRRMFSNQLKVTTWFPTAEDVVVQKLRWGRGKDLEDARDVIAVQGLEALDMTYYRKMVRHPWHHGPVNKRAIGNTTDGLIGVNKSEMWKC